MAGWSLDSGILLQFTPSHVPPASHLPYSSVHSWQPQGAFLSCLSPYHKPGLWGEVLLLNYLNANSAVPGNSLISSLGSTVAKLGTGLGIATPVQEASQQGREIIKTALPCLPVGCGDIKEPH